MTGALFAVAVYAVVGWALLALLRVDVPLLAPAVGLAATGIVLATAATAGIPFAVAATALAAVAVVAFARRGRPRPAPPPLAALVLAAFVALQAAIAAARPLTAFDGLVTWAFKAHALLVHGDVSSPAFDAALNPGPHPEYPVLWPSLQALALRLGGGYDDATLRAHGLAALGCLLLGAYALLRRHAGDWLALAFVAPLAASPVVVANASAGNADAVLAGLAALALLLVAGPERDARLAALALGAMLLTKNEGLVGAGAIVAAGLLAPAGPRRPLLLAAAAAAAAALPWRVHRVRAGLRDADLDLSPSVLVDNLDRLPGTLATILGRVLAPSAWALATILALVLVARGPRRGFAAAWAGLFTAALTASYLVTTLAPGARLTANAERTTMQLAFGLVCLAALAVRRRGSA